MRSAQILTNSQETWLENYSDILPSHISIPSIKHKKQRCYHKKIVNISVGSKNFLPYSPMSARVPAHTQTLTIQLGLEPKPTVESRPHDHCWVFLRWPNGNTREAGCLVGSGEVFDSIVTMKKGLLTEIWSEKMHMKEALQMCIHLKPFWTSFSAVW